MSLGSSISRVGYVGAGTTATFTFPFKIFDPTELLIATLNTTTGVQTTLVLSTDYSVLPTGVNNPSGGSITLTAGSLAVGTSLVIVRKRQLLQQTDLRNQGDYYPEVVEDTFDMMVMNDQQIQRELNNAIKLPLTIDPSVFNPVLPALSPANASIVVNSTGTGYAMGPTADQLAAGIAAGTQSVNSAAAAATSAGAAAVSATNAATSATQSSGYANSSMTSATSSQNSATSAQSLAGQAQTSANNAAASATSANTSAQNAASSQSTASTAATNASTSATNAANSATSAANSASQAQASSQVIPTGGTAGQILLKKSSTNYDTQWATNTAGITQLTGDVTSPTGSGSVATTITGLSRSKLATDTASAVVFNDASGNLTSEAQLAKVRGGTGADNSNVTFPSSGTVGTVPVAGFVKSSGSALTSQSAINLANSDVTGTLPVAQGGTGTTSLPASGFVKSSGTALSSVSAITLSSDTTGILPTGNGGTGQNSTATFPTSGTVGVVPAAGFVKSASGQLTSQSSIALSTDVSGTLPVANGGTGSTSLPASGFVKSSGTALTSQTAINIASADVTGTLPIGSGGTGATSIATGFVTSTGSALGSKSAIALGTDISGTLPIANGGTALTSAPAAGFVTSTGSAFSSKTAVVLTSDVSGTLPIASGGTGQTTATAALNALLPTQSTAGQVLTTNGTSTSFATPFTSPLTTKGDLHGFSTTDARIPAGSTGQLLTYDSTQSTGLKWAFPASSGGKNYLGTVNGTNLNGDFESGATSGFALATATLSNLIPSGAPSAGATSITTFAATNTTPIAGTYSLNVASTGAITAGQGFISNARTIDIADQARMMSFSFAYKVMSGVANLNFSGTSANSFQVYVYDVTNAVWIQPAGVYSMVQSSGVGIATGTFQTSANGTQYQLAVLCINATGGAASIYFDSFALGPQSAGAIGYSGGDLVSFGANIVTATTTAPTKGTTSNDLLRWRRVGDHSHIKGEYKQTAAGSAGSGDYLFQLPTGQSFDSNKVTFFTTVIGQAAWPSQAALGSVTLSIATTQHVGAVLPYDATHFRIATIQVSSGAGGYSEGVIGSAFGGFGNTAMTITFDFMAPIAGWSSNAVQSSDVNNRIVTTQATTSSSQSITAGTKFALNTVVFDTIGAFSAANNNYVAQAPGFLQVFFLGTCSSGGTTPYVYKNGVQGPALTTINTTGVSTGATEIQVVAGDVIDIRADATATVNANARVTITQVTGSATVQASESVNCAYQTTAGNSVGTSFTNIAFATKYYDSHSAYNGTSYVCPVAGKYRVSTNLLTVAVALSTTTAFNGGVQQAGSASVFKYLGQSNGNGASITQMAASSASFNCLAGDTLTIQASCGSATTLNTVNGTNHFEIERTGN